MDRAAHWFLDSVIYNTYPVWWLGAPAEELEMMINHTAHGLSPKRVAETLYDLTLSGDLAMYGPPPDSTGTHSEEQHQIQVQCTVDQIEDAVRRNHHLRYELTPQGGARWESVARPVWEHYVSVEYIGELGLGEHRIVTSIDQHLIEYYLDNYRYDNPEEAIDLESIRWSIVRPWEALYWKVLPSAVQATFTVAPQEMEQDPVWHEHRWSILQRWIADTTWYSSYDEVVGNL